MSPFNRQNSSETSNKTRTHPSPITASFKFAQHTCQRPLPPPPAVSYEPLVISAVSCDPLTISAVSRDLQVISAVSCNQLVISAVSCDPPVISAVSYNQLVISAVRCDPLSFHRQRAPWRQSAGGGFIGVNLCYAQT